MQSKVVGLDVDQLKAEIAKTYTAVSCEPERKFIFPTGRAWAEDLGYPPDLLARVPDTACESFAGVANPFLLGRLAPGEHVLDLGSGAGTDSLVAAQMVGAEGSVTGIDMTPAMLDRARRAAKELGAANVRFVEAVPERLLVVGGARQVHGRNAQHDDAPSAGMRRSSLFPAAPRFRSCLPRR